VEVWKMARSLNVLVLEDRAGDAELMIDELLTAGFEPAWTRVETETEYLAALESDPDVILADYHLPRFDAPRALQLLQERGKDIPILVVTGAVDEETAVHCMKQGAADYLLKDRMARLGPAVEQALLSKELRDQKRRDEWALRVRSTAVESTTDGVIVTDDTGRITLANDAAARMFGREGEDLSGGRVAEFVPELEQHVVCRWLSSRAANEVGATFEAIGIHSDGEDFPVEVSVAPIRGAGPATCVLNVRDVTQRHQAERERELRLRLDADNRELQRVNEMTNQFSAAVSHELRTPLTSVVAFADLLARKGGHNLSDRQFQQVGAIQRNAHRLMMLTNDLLDASRMQGGKLRIEPERFDARPLFEELAEGFAPLLAERGQTLRLELPAGSLWIDADRERLAQVVTNLLSNASKYSPDGSAVEMEATAAGEWLYLRVRDHGIGIPEEDQPKVFTPFFRAANAPTRGASGTGLGLFVVKSIVELHNGTIWLESAPGVGTEVHVGVPCALPEAPAHHDTAPPSAGRAA